MEGNDKYLGRILDNRYEILELIGVGGMAYVYKALCHRLNRLVAIKILKEELANDEEFQRRFYTESQAVAMLSHPNIVAVYDVSRSGNTEYIVMELIEGITLKQYINRKGLLNWKEALHFATQIVKALNHAHSRGIIHRDIKPHNIMILKDGSIKVADFGIARLLSVQNTLTQEALGSVHYISPEQAKGGQIDARSDIYSVGVVMYEMLTSRLPFVGDSAVSVAIQHISAIPLSPRDINPDIPIGLEEITMHAMEPDVNTRFTTAEEMLNDLEEFRKYPGIIFNYSSTNPSGIRPAEPAAPYETRMIPRADANRGIQPLNPRPKTEMTSDEYRDVKKRSGSTATLVGIFAVVVFLVVLLAVFILPPINSWFRQPEEVVNIPSFIGSQLSDVLANDEWDALFTFDPSFVYRDGVPEGEIMQQDPTANRTRSMPIGNDRIPIRLVVSSGDNPPIEMPDLLGLHYIEAENRLARLGIDLIVDPPEPVESDEERGIVTETVPAAGQMIANGSRILIRYSLGAARDVRVPANLVNRTEAVVDASLRDHDLVPEIDREYDPNAAAGIVVFVEREGQLVPVGSTIRIIVSLGPEPTPTPTPDPEFSVTVNGGSGSGSFTAGTNIQINAEPPAGQQFVDWVISPGVVFTVGNNTTASATFIMPSSAVVVTASFEAIPDPNPPPEP